jgi:surfeit locus 1 family protein
MTLLRVLLVTGALSVFVALGMWQLNRAQEKEMIRDRMRVRANLPAVALDTTRVVSDEMMFRKAEARGSYLPEYQVFLDNKVYRGESGYQVLTPLRIRGTDMHLLVNRGWAPWGLDRRRAPVAESPAGEVTVTGRLAIPVRAPISLGDDDAQQGFARVWQNFDLERYRALIGAPVVDLVMELDAESGASDLVRDWPSYDDAWIQRHHAYAIQWFGVAALFLVIVLFRLRSKR